MTYNVKSAAKAALVLLSFAALAGCEAPTKARTAEQAPATSECNCTSTLRRVQEHQDYTPAPLRRSATVKRAASRRATGHVASRSSYSSYSSSSYAESDYYSSSYVSQSSVTGSASSSSYRASASAYGGSGYAAHSVPKVTHSAPAGTGWVDGYGKHYAAGTSYGAGYPVYRDGDRGAAYLDVQTDDRARGASWYGYNFRTGLSNGY